MPGAFLVQVSYNSASSYRRVLLVFGLLFCHHITEHRALVTFSEPCLCLPSTDLPLVSLVGVCALPLPDSLEFLRSESLDPLLEFSESELLECLLPEDCSLKSLDEEEVEADKDDGGPAITEGLSSREPRAWRILTLAFLMI